jgi:rhamnose transport system ATP-binding protein
MASLDQVVAALSGGNRQKVVLGKWLATEPSVLILDEPTHGIDVGTKAQVHEIIAGLASRGLAILVISSDLPEVLAISDRILVIADGFLTAELTGGETDQEQVMVAATSHRVAAA